MFRWLSSYFLLIALAVAGMIPAGWMPEVGEDGRVLLVICTADGIQERWVDLGDEKEQPSHEDSDHEGSRVCPFGALTQSALVPNTAALALALPMTPQRSPWAHELFTHASAGFHWRYDARGPPALS